MSTPAPYVGSLLRVALPLIISGLASNLSIFIDRAILSHYDIIMMSHVSTVSNYCWMILYLTGGITYISKVFVGRFNGAKQYDLVTAMAWQMIFFSLSCLILFMLAYFAAPTLLPTIAHQHGLVYFKVIMLGGVFWPLTGSLCSFFLGTYQVRTVFCSLMLANVLNITLDLLWIPQLGTYGAALATIVAMAAQFVFLFMMFLNHYNRTTYKTHRVTYNQSLLYQAIRIGYPESLSHFFEMMAWACVITIISTKGQTFMLVSNLAQNLFILFMFVYTEIGNAVKSMCANYIGEDKASHIPRLVFSSMVIHTAFITAIACITLLFPSVFIDAFSINQESLHVQALVVKSLQGVFLFMFFDGVTYILASVLSAHGDTFASMVIMTGSMWMFLVIPTYYLIHFTNPTASTHSTMILPFYGLITSLCYIWRYQTGPKQELVFTIESTN